ncbi:MAG: methyltransferase domain-containing protein [Alphaproteobacteria bacterium]|nr:methyltransferase domain-containing protein [Alphaproteobacteria bacterium]
MAHPKGFYVHGYHPGESERLKDQAGTLADLLLSDTYYTPGCTVLEAGCGVGAQTLTLAQRSPDARFTSIDLSRASLNEAEALVSANGIVNVHFEQADIFYLPYKPNSFDHVFVCFVLEHLSDPARALKELEKVLNPGGTLTVIEGDHGSTYFYPDSDAARAAIRCQIELQRSAGGNALIGRQLYPLMIGARLQQVRVSPRMVYVDGSRPDLIEGFTRKTFVAMIEAVRQAAVDAEIIDPVTFDAGIRDLQRAARQDGVFCYTFFKGVGHKGA